MRSPRPSGMQLKALLLLDESPDHNTVLSSCDVSERPANRGLFIMRLLDRGWVKLVLTPTGRAILEAADDAGDY